MPQKQKHLLVTSDTVRETHIKTGWAVHYKTGYGTIFTKTSLLVLLQLAILKDH